MAVASEANICNLVSVLVWRANHLCPPCLLKIACEWWVCCVYLSGLKSGGETSDWMLARSKYSLGNISNTWSF